jgi:opacity protein-like surface antigen
MASKWLWITFVLTTLIASAAAQDKNELSGIIGRTFISDQGVRGISAPDTNVHFGNGLSIEANYGRHLLNAGIAGLTFEVPFVYNPDEDLHFSVNVIPEGYSAYFLTPSIRANLVPDSGLSPWVSFGVGFAHFSESSNLELGGTNPGKTGSTSAAIQAGLGLDVKIWRNLRLRGEVRDFYTGVPQLNVDTGKSRQHNFFVGGGAVWHF